MSSRWKPSYPFRCNLSVSLSVQALNVTKAEWPANRIPVLRRSSLPSISDIVKRKRIRSKAGWGEACSRKIREDPRAARRRVIILSLEQPVVGLEPDRSDPRMRLKQNWSFQAKTCVVERLPIINRQTETRALAMRAIKCLKGIWWMPWR